MMQSTIPKEVQARTGAAQTAQVLANYAEYGIANGEQLGGNTPLSDNIKELNRIAKDDPSLNQYLTPTLKALMNYDGNTDPAIAFSPFSVGPELPPWGLKVLNDSIETALMTDKDFSSGEVNKNLFELKKMTDQNPKWLNYLDPNVRAEVVAAVAAP